MGARTSGQPFVNGNPPYHDTDLALGLARPMPGRLVALESWHAFTDLPNGGIYTAQVANSGAISHVDASIQRCTTGAVSAAGRAAVAGNNTALAALLTTALRRNVRVSTRINVTTLSTAAQEFLAPAGFNDQVAAALPGSTGAMLLYDRAARGTNWRAYTERAGVAEDDDTGIAVTAGAWVRYRCEVWGTSQIRHYLDNRLVALQAGFAAGAFLGTLVGIYKSVGTTARTLDVDYIELEIREEP